MIDASTIKNKSIVSFDKNGQTISCPVVSATPTVATVTLPDGSVQDLPIHYITDVKNAVATTPIAPVVTTPTEQG